jgi:hypothetical protein
MRRDVSNSRVLRRFGWHLAKIIAIGGAATCPFPAAAQTVDASTTAAAGAPPPSLVQTPDGCAVTAVPTGTQDVLALTANCHGSGLLLGRATHYRTIENPKIKATLVDMTLGSERRILLLSLGSDGRARMQDISGDVARNAGKGVMASISDVSVDIGGFAADGTIAVQPATGAVRELAVGAEAAAAPSN